MEMLTNLNINAVVGMIAAAIAVIVGVRLREIGIRTYAVVLLTAVLFTAAIIETWFADTTLFKSAAIGWVVGYLTDDVILTLDALMPNFIRETIDKFLRGFRKKLEKLFGIDDNQ